MTTPDIFPPAEPPDDPMPSDAEDMYEAVAEHLLRAASEWVFDLVDEDLNHPAVKILDAFDMRAEVYQAARVVAMAHINAAMTVLLSED